MCIVCTLRQKKRAGTIVKRPNCPHTQAPATTIMSTFKASHSQGEESKGQGTRVGLLTIMLDTTLQHTEASLVICKKGLIDTTTSVKPAVPRAKEPIHSRYPPSPLPAVDDIFPTTPVPLASAEQGTSIRKRKRWGMCHPVVLAQQSDPGEESSQRSGKPHQWGGPWAQQAISGRQGDKKNW